MYRIEKQFDDFVVRGRDGRVVQTLRPGPAKVLNFGVAPSDMVWFQTDAPDIRLFDIASGRLLTCEPIEPLSASEPPLGPPNSLSVRAVAPLSPCRSLPSGGSWFGGRPRLPGNLAWPVARGHAFVFICQIDCAQLPPSVWNGIGPRHGSLAIFANHHAALEAQVLFFEGQGGEQTLPAPIFADNFHLDFKQPEPPAWRVDIFAQERAEQASSDSHPDPDHPSLHDCAMIDTRPDYFPTGYSGVSRHEVVLIEVPTSHMFGWQWSDWEHLVLLIDRDALARNDFSQIRCEFAAEE